MATAEQPSPTPTTAPPASPPTSPLPTHPRLRPGLAVLTRDAGTAQIGLGTGAVLLHHCDEGLVQLLDRLDGTRSLAQLGAAHPRAPEAVELLAELGLLHPEGPAAEATGTVLLLGAGVLGRAIALRLHDLGVSLLLWDPDPAPDGCYPGPPRTTAALSLRALLRTRSSGSPSSARIVAPVSATVLAHWSEVVHPEPALAVLALDRAETDRGLTDSLLRRDLPHLLLRPLDAGAQVGPFVLPGQGCCTRCTDLYRVGRDPLWPRLLAQLIRRRHPVGDAVADWAAAVAVPVVVAALRGQRPGLLGHTVELEPPDWTPTLRRWPIHPDCGCALPEVG